MRGLASAFRASHERGQTVLCTIALALVMSGCFRDEYMRPLQARNRTIGDAHHGADLIAYYGCGGCHTINGIGDANGTVGPPLNNFANRIYIAGMLRNTPDNLVRWIRNPQAVVPGNVMPDMGIDSSDAHDIAAYLDRGS